MTGIMPSSTHATACYSGPTGVITQHPTQPMHAYQYKNIGPLSTGMGSPAIANPSQRSRFIHHDSTTTHQVGNNSGAFGSPSPHGTVANGSYSARASNSRTHHNTHAIPQPANGVAPSNPTELMSMSMHAPASNYHYWPAAAVMMNPSNPTSGNTPTLNTGASPYAHANLVPGTGIPHGNHPSNPVGVSDFQSKHNGTATAKSGAVNGSSHGSKAGNASSTSGSNRPLWKERPHVGRYSLIRTIGKGNFAKVKLAQHLTTGMQVAVKVIDKTLLNQSSMQKLFREVRVLKTLNHPNIIKLLEVIESERHLYLVMEYASGGEVFDFLVSHGKMKEADARVKFRQIVSAVQYCHQKMVVHRDLKAENLLLDSDLNIKIADFGFSNYFSTSQKLDTFCGSPPYAAPELFLGRKYEGPEVDVWSLGVILYTLVSGTLPFDGKNLKELRERVLRGTYRVPFYMTHECETLLKKMLVLNPAKRLPLAEVMRDPWLNQGFDMVLRPYNEPPADYCDPERIDTMVRMGFKPNEIQEALTQQRFNNITATYILLGRYDPKVHGRLPGLSNASHSMSRLSNKSDTYQGDFSLNGTTQPINSSSKSGGGSLYHAQRPASAVPTTQHHFANNRNATQSRRTPDEGLFSRTAAAFTTRTLQEQFAADKDSSTRIATSKQSASSGSSSMTTTSSSSTDATSSKVTAIVSSSASTSGRPYPTVRRAATSYEPRASIPTSATITNIMPNNSNTGRESRKSSSSSPPPPSQAPPPDHPSHVLPLPTQQSSAIMVHPPAVTTAHLVLTNGPSATPTHGPGSVGSPNIHTIQRSVVRGGSSATAPLAKDEEEAFASPGSGNCRRNSSKPVVGSLEAKPTSNDTRTSRSSSSSSSDDTDSASDIYDRDVVSGSSNGSVNSPTTRAHLKKNRENGALDTNVTSVVLAAAPTVNSPNSSNSLHGRQPNSVTPAEPSAKMIDRGSEFNRMPSVRRKSSIHSNAEPNDSKSPKTNAPSSRGTRPSSVEPQQQTAISVGSPNPKPRMPSVKNRDGIREDTPNYSAKDAQPQTKPRSLFRGHPNAADILSENNPFRAAADVAIKPTPPAIPPHNNRTSLSNNQTSSTRGMSPPNSNATASAIRRPAAPPPPPLATNCVTNPPSRTSYAYHSLRLPSSTTTTTIAMGKEGTSDLNSRLYPRPVDPASNSRWSSSHGRDSDMITPTPGGTTNASDIYSVPFNRNLPERSTIQHIPTGRARERLEGISGGPRLVRHAGTHSIATQSIRIRPASPPFRTDDSNLATPRANSPDDLSISSVASSASTLGQNDGVFERRRFGDSPPVDYPNRGNSVMNRQRNTLGSPVQGFTRNFSVRPPNSRDNQANGGFNNFFRTLTTRISRSKLFRRSTVMQTNADFNDQDLGHHDPRHNRLDPMLAPTMELDKVVVTRGSSSPESLKPSVNRIPRSRSGVASHRPVSQTVGRFSDAMNGDSRNSRKIERCPTPTELEQSTIKRKGSIRSSSSRGNRSRSVQRPSKSDETEERTPPSSTQQNNTRAKRGSNNSDRRKRSPSPVSKTESETTRTFGNKNNRSMRYVLRPFARWPLDEVMVEVQRSLTNHGVDFEVVGEHKLQCVFGDPSHGCQVPTLQNTTSMASPSPNSLLDPGLDSGVVQWEMEIGKLAAVGMNGIRFKRIDGSMAAFKQIAKKLAADLKL